MSGRARKKTFRVEGLDERNGLCLA